MVINGKEYPLWSQFVDKKKQFIGQVMIDRDMVINGQTTITDIILRENGTDSAWFEVVGRDFSCGFDVQSGGITSGEDGYITFSRFNMRTFSIKGTSNE